MNNDRMSVVLEINRYITNIFNVCEALHKELWFQIYIKMQDLEEVLYDLILSENESEEKYSREEVIKRIYPLFERLTHGDNRINFSVDNIKSYAMDSLKEYEIINEETLKQIRIDGDYCFACYLVKILKTLSGVMIDIIDGEVNVLPEEENKLFNFIGCNICPIKWNIDLFSNEIDGSGLPIGCTKKLTLYHSFSVSVGLEYSLLNTEQNIDLFNCYLAAKKLVIYANAFKSRGFNKKDEIFAEFKNTINSLLTKIDDDKAVEEFLETVKMYYTTLTKDCRILNIMES